MELFFGYGLVCWFIIGGLLAGASKAGGAKTEEALGVWFFVILVGLVLLTVTGLSILGITALIDAVRS